MKTQRIMLATAALWAIAYTMACADFIEIGTGTGTGDSEFAAPRKALATRMSCLIPA